MYKIPFSKTLQPRVGATWAYNGKDTIYASFARYVPAASSLPRAASWARNLAVHDPAPTSMPAARSTACRTSSGSSGKLFVRRHDAAHAPTSTSSARPGSSANGLTGRVYCRYREGSHFWEDTNNNARVRFNPPSEHPADALHPGPLGDNWRRSAAGRAT